MSIPDSTHLCWQKLASNSVPGFTPKQLALQLLFTRLKNETMSVRDKADAIHAFFVKYEKILTAEMNQLRDLHQL